MSNVACCILVILQMLGKIKLRFQLITTTKIITIIIIIIVIFHI